MRTIFVHPTVVWTFILVLACLLAAALFLLGVATAGTYFGAAFLMPIIVVFLWGRPRDIYLVAALGGLLVAAGCWFGGIHGPADLLVNCGLPLLVLGATAVLLARYRRQQDQVVRRARELEAGANTRAAALQASEEKLAKIFRANPGGIAILRQADGHIFEVNDAFLNMVGFTRDQLLGRNPDELGIITPAVSTALREAAQGQGFIHGQDVQVTNAGGDAVDILLSVEQLDIGGVPYFLVLVLDISERKQLETALRESEENYRTLFNQAGDGIYTVDAEGRYTEANDRFCRLLDRTRAEILSARLSDIAVDVTPEFFAAIGEELALHGSATFERQLRHKDGTLLEVEITAAPLSGKRRVGIVRDISRRKAAERALRASEEKFAHAFAANPAGIAISRFADGCFLDANPVYLQMVGYTRAELVGRRSVDLGIMSPAARAEVVARAARQTSSTPFEVQVRAKDGRTVEIMTAFTTIDVDGEPCLLTMAVDITERKQYEKLLQETNAVLEQRVAERTADLRRAVDDLQRANLLKDEFMAMISHELRTPLTGVLSLAEMLGDQIAGPLNERQSVYVRGITESGSRLLYVINGILSYTHLISGKLPLQAEPCDLANLLNICAVSQQHKAAAKGLSIAVRVEPPGLSITSDESALAAIVKRLLDNAVKFTPEGGQIGLVANAGAARGTVDLIVWDTGIGIPAEQIEHILKPFAQADGSLARRYDGIGMGLAYVQEMVHRLGGTLAVESTPGGGSTFTITLEA